MNGYPSGTMLLHALTTDGFWEGGLGPALILAQIACKDPEQKWEI